jgi:hypothetical protein
MAFTNEDISNISALIHFADEHYYVLYLFRPNLPHTPERLDNDEPNYTAELKVGAKIDDGDGNHCLVMWTYTTEAYDEIKWIAKQIVGYEYDENDERCVFNG